MENEIVESYTWNILKKKLQKAKISNTALYNKKIKTLLFPLFMGFF